MNLFTCPICLRDLQLNENVLRCSESHSFDISSEGYVNLLPSHHKRSRNPGDDATMVAVRRQFLDAGFYKPLIDAVLDLLAERHNITTLVDLGCGEGYFTSAFSTIAPQVYGVDISKPAIKRAAKTYENVNFGIANTLNLPLQSAQFDVASIIMAPLTPDAARILKPGGLLVRVSPGSQHLIEVKRLVYAEAIQHERAELNLPYFSHTTGQQVKFEMQLSIAEQRNLVAMTPMAHRTQPALRELKKSHESMLVQASFWIDLFERAGNPAN